MDNEAQRRGNVNEPNPHRAQRESVWGIYRGGNHKRTCADFPAHSTNTGTSECRARTLGLARLFPEHENPLHRKARLFIGSCFHCASELFHYTQQVARFISQLAFCFSRHVRAIPPIGKTASRKLPSSVNPPKKTFGALGPYGSGYMPYRGPAQSPIGSVGQWRLRCVVCSKRALASLQAIAIVIKVNAVDHSPG